MSTPVISIMPKRPREHKIAITYKAQQESANRLDMVSKLDLSIINNTNF